LIKAVIFKRIQHIRLILSTIWFINRISVFRYFALNSLDIEIEQILNYDNGYFIEIGANNGVNQSNTLYFEKFRGWRGLLIEPHPKLFSQLKKNRSHKSTCINAACTSFSFKNDSLKMMYSDLMTTSVDESNILPNSVEHALLGSKYLVGQPSEFTAKSETMQQILERISAPKCIDLFSLDVEGFEFEVLSGINHKIFRFNLICVETSDIPRMEAFMAKINYELVKQVTHHDLFFRDRTIRMPLGESLENHE
jgi:FkbM family methyltransferase